MVPRAVRGWSRSGLRTQPHFGPMRAIHSDSRGSTRTLRADQCRPWHVATPAGFRDGGDCRGDPWRLVALDSIEMGLVSALRTRPPAAPDYSLRCQRFPRLDHQYEAVER